MDGWPSRWQRSQFFFFFNSLFHDATPRLRPTGLVGRPLIRHEKVSFPCCRLPDWGCQRWAALGLEYVLTRRVQRSVSVTAIPERGFLKPQPSQSRLMRPATHSTANRLGFPNGAMDVTVLCPVIHGPSSPADS
jgi:hypothetical protein